MRLPVIITVCSLGGAALMLSGCATPAGQTTASRQAATNASKMGQTSKKADDSQIVCKNSYYQGSMIRDKRNCHTIAEWKRMNENQQKDTARGIREMQTKGLMSNSPRG